MYCLGLARRTTPRPGRKAAGAGESQQVKQTISGT
jgi:hypothetical protein